MSEIPRKRKAVVINRKTWLRGEGIIPSRLLRSLDGKMCCVGFICLAEGAPEEAIKDKPALHNIDPKLFDFNTISRLQAIHNTANNPYGLSVYSLNDNENFNDAEREKLLTAKLDACGYDITFES